MPLKTLKIAVLAPTPSASVRTTMSVYTGFFSNARAPWRRSCQIFSISLPLKYMATGESALGHLKLSLKKTRQTEQFAPPRHYQASCRVSLKTELDYIA